MRIRQVHASKLRPALFVRLAPKTKIGSLILRLLQSLATVGTTDDTSSHYRSTRKAHQNGSCPVASKLNLPESAAGSILREHLAMKQTTFTRCIGLALSYLL